MLYPTLYKNIKSSIPFIKLYIFKKYITLAIALVTFLTFKRDTANNCFSKKY